MDPDDELRKALGTDQPDRSPWLDGGPGTNIGLGRPTSLVILGHEKDHLLEIDLSTGEVRGRLEDVGEAAARFVKEVRRLVAPAHPATRYRLDRDTGWTRERAMTYAEAVEFGGRDWADRLEYNPGEGPPGAVEETVTHDYIGIEGDSSRCWRGYTVTDRADDSQTCGRPYDDPIHNPCADPALAAPLRPRVGDVRRRWALEFKSPLTRGEWHEHATRTDRAELGDLSEWTSGSSTCQVRIVEVLERRTVVEGPGS